MTPKKDPHDPDLARNRRALHEYHVLERFEAGLELSGTEVKALRAGRGQITEAFARVERGEAWLIQAHIGEYEMGNRQNHVAERRRRLLLHRREITYLDLEMRQGGLTMVPLRLYLKANRIKAEIALVRGKKLWDKRQTIAERDSRRDAEREMARSRRAG
ncbi:MAG: SsrA-binding protein SmpB [Candidatus Dormibacteria bacterium]